MNTSSHIRIALVGGGPAALFMFKKLCASGMEGLEVTIFERKGQLGSGMPYSPEGAGPEHITNVSDNELPPLVSSMKEWAAVAPSKRLAPFSIDSGKFNEYKVVPRLLLGAYLSDQFDLLLQSAKQQGISTQVHFGTEVTDICDEGPRSGVRVMTATGKRHRFDAVVICTGHRWPTTHEGKVSNWFDSPYPPAKLQVKANFPVAVKGASLTAIDAVRTLARHNGRFVERGGRLEYEPHPGSSSFRLVMHSLGGLLPAIRFHLEDTHLSRDTVITQEEMFGVMEANGGLMPLDYLFERNFLQPLSQRNPEFYERVKHLSIEGFVAEMMELRERLDPFTLFEAEYAEAERSIRRRQSVNWKEELAVLSYAMNYPAKHLSAEDMIRLKTVLMPLISLVIAFVPQGSARELMALHRAGVLRLVAVDRESSVEPLEGGGALYRHTNEAGELVEEQYRLFVNATGQPQFSFSDLPFESLRREGTVSPAFLRFRSAAEGAACMTDGSDVEQGSDGHYYLRVPGVSINDYFQVLDRFGAYNDRIYMMAVPYIGGYNPDYSGLDFCDAASDRILAGMMAMREQNTPRETAA